MRIAVISDLHIGKEDIDLLDHTDAYFSGFLKNLEISFDKIVLLGDIIETLMPEFPGEYEKAFWNAWNHRRQITSRFESNQYTYVYGNHDWIAQKTVNAKERLQIEHKNRKVLFVHGHQTDKVYSKNIAESIVFSLGWGIRAGLGSLYRKLAYMESIRHIRGLYLGTEIKKLSRQYDANTIVMGHTHTAMIKDFGNILYLNSGHCSFGRIHFISMDLDNDKFELHYF